ncbi:MULTISPECIES: prepilin-type N-terminal cleavage/methylation domain-containing protein [Thioalkalivibrio]|uniref:Type II secretion system protein H n=1 Tax=Thioalkalivibrio halophilus TaxID=252474 RepID=A0A1V2ZVG8_9GAMM|nr:MULTISPECIES: prepilin-type N-terminal cleavage/methylation domain-containing protein [Thioalkalivibrio]OOC09127.1 type II secretion system protein GspH [Thioalkalivibrio halophilus]PYG04218.1 general secretion pathway protein H [Thioalkalivibrio sp. ALE21]
MTRARQVTGFTLLEVLVVMVIIGVLAGAALLSTGQLGGRALEQTGHQLAGQIELARDQALLTGQPLAIGVARERLAVLERQWLDDRQVTWVPVEQGPLAPRDLGSLGLEPRLWIDDRRASLSERPEENLITINSAGDIQAFELILQRAGDEASLRLHSDGTRRVRMDRENR